MNHPMDSSMDLSLHPYAPFIHEVARPARYLGGEYLQIRKDPGSVAATIALAFPDVYEIGMSHLGMKILYSLLNKNPLIAAERVFAPWLDMEEALRKRHLPLVTLENALPLKQFDLVGFSLQYEMTYTNILNMLDLSDIPIRASQRDLDMPFIIAGGPCATHPEPIAPFIDLFLIGDGEGLLPRLILTYKRLKSQGRSKTDILIELSKLGGIYCPALYTTRDDGDTGFTVVDEPIFPDVPKRVVRHYVANLDEYPFPTDSPVANTEAVFDRLSIEIARGCTEGCRFCQAGMIYRPVRERDPESIIQTVMEGVKKGGYDEVSITSLSTADVSCISPLVKKLMERLKAEKVSLSVSSLRAYGLSDDLLQEIADVRNTSLTFAPEAGTQRMRDVISKNITEEDIAKSAHNVFSRGWNRMKLYFMIGLPTEEMDDVTGICETGRLVKTIGKQYHKPQQLNVTVSVSSFVPKPHTPFQWVAMNTLEQIYEKQKTLKNMAQKYGLKIKCHDPETSMIECLISRGDRRIGDVIETAWRKGCRFDGWTEMFDFKTWISALEETHIDPNVYFQTIPLDAPLPWRHIDVGITDRFLEMEYQKTLRSRLSPPCGKPFKMQVHHTNVVEAQADLRKLICYDCGIACDLTQMREERIDFLKHLGATEPIAPRPFVPPVKPGENKPRADFKQTHRYRYRAEFTKLGRAAYTSHLDLIRFLARIIRRSGYEMIYSEGFHPKPVMSFGPALGVGVESLGEMVDFELAEAVNTTDLCDALNVYAPEGVHFRNIVEIKAEMPALAKAVNVGDYLFLIPKSALKSWGISTEQYILAESHLGQKMSEIKARGAFMVNRTTQDKTRQVNILPYILSVVWLNLDDEDASSRFGLKVRLSITPEGSARPEEVIRMIFGEPKPAFNVMRLALFSLGDDQITRSPLTLEPTHLDHTALNLQTLHSLQYKPLRDLEPVLMRRHALPQNIPFTPES